MGKFMNIAEDWDIVSSDELNELTDHEYELISLPEVTPVPTFAEIAKATPVYQKSTGWNNRIIKKRKKKRTFGAEIINPLKKYNQDMEPEPFYLQKVHRNFDPAKPKNARRSSKR